MKKCITTGLAGAFVVFVLLLSTGANVFAQQDTAAIAGVVTDSSGGAISGAKVVVNEESAGVTRETTTGPTGFYQFVSLPPGTYNIKVEMADFEQR